MIWFKRFLAALAALLLLAAAAAGIYVYRASPALDGELQAAGLQGRVAVARDPHQAIPLHGTYFGSANAFLGMDVAIRVVSAGEEAKVQEAC